VNQTRFKLRKRHIESLVTSRAVAPSSFPRRIKKRPRAVRRALNRRCRRLRDVVAAPAFVATSQDLDPVQNDQFVRDVEGLATGANMLADIVETGTSVQYNILSIDGCAVHRTLQNGHIQHDRMVLVRWIGFQGSTWEPESELRQTAAYEAYFNHCFIAGGIVNDHGVVDKTQS
jgi:hypothetical protein